MHDGMQGICRDDAQVKFPRAVRNEENRTFTTSQVVLSVFLHIPAGDLPRLHIQAEKRAHVAEP